MENLVKYNNAFKQCFSVSDEQLDGNLTYQSIPSWDSVGHMQLIAFLEECFAITMETEDIIDFSSYEKGKTILRKYGVVI